MPCSEPHCPQKVKARGLCRKHYTSPRRCSVEGCERAHAAKGYCEPHYYLWKTGALQQAAVLHPPQEVCSFERCGKQARVKGYCRTHYNKMRREGSGEDLTIRRRGRRCSHLDCGEFHYAKGLCERHYYLWKRNGDPESSVRVPKGSGYLNKGGYRVVYVDRRPILEHRLVMEKMLQRPLRSKERVHHINGDRADNRPENLELWFLGHPSGQRVEDLVSWAREVLKQYEHLYTEGSRSSPS